MRRIVTTKLSDLRYGFTGFAAPSPSDAVLEQSLLQRFVKVNSIPQQTFKVGFV